jgi:hypothetical protein
MKSSSLRIALGSLSFAVLLPCFAATPGAPQSSTFDLFTPAEALAWNTKKPGTERSTERSIGAPGEINCHSPPAAAQTSGTDPQIKILAPTLDKPLNAPIDIDVQFVPTGASAIKPETFRVCYMGFLTMDITQRITDRVAVSPSGIRVSGAQLPSGHHHLLMLIADQQGHVGRQEVVFEIK